MDLVVGIDLATAAVRTIAADASGNVCAFAEQPLPEPAVPRPGWCEQDPSAWWPAVSSALAQLTECLGSRSRRVAAVSVSATSATVVGLDAEGLPVGRALTYADQRAVDEAATAQAAAPERWASLGLTMAPSFGLPKWGWLLRQAGAAPVVRLGHASDVIVNRLTGVPAPTDTSHALKSGFDPVRREWVGEAMQALGIDEDLLPEVLLPGSSAGRLSRDAAGATGLPAGCEIKLGMTDSCASQLAAGAAEPGRFVSVLGSTLVLKGASARPVADPAGAVYSHLHPGGWWLPGGASSTGGRILTTEFAGDDLGQLDAGAAAGGPSGVVTYPLLGRGERFPFACAEAEGFTLGTPLDRFDRYRAILEGVAFVERLGYERLRTLGAEPKGPIVSSGRASKSAVWNVIRATVLGTSLEAKPAAGTALGACILAASGTLHPDLRSATAAMAAEGLVFEPNGAEVEALEHGYRRFLQAVTERGWLQERQ
ncbi:MAG TPA: FGGY family carbohydrate kinase [Actinomycetota bacterium]|nr:FGGY family carbohydrate kinase [Actinomycetota bacterium]